MTEEQEMQLLQENTPYSLPDNPSQSGWTAQQTKEKFWKGYFILYNLLKEVRTGVTGFNNTTFNSIATAVNAILDGTTKVPKAIADKNGNDIAVTYAKKSEITTGGIGAKKYVKADGTTANIEALETTLSALNTLIQTALPNGKAANSALADSATKATKDNIGNIINETYATIASLNAIATQIANILNGASTCDKARKDQDGNRIDLVYAKKAEIQQGGAITADDYTIA